MMFCHKNLRFIIIPHTPNKTTPKWDSQIKYLLIIIPSYENWQLSLQPSQPFKMFSLYIYKLSFFTKPLTKIFFNFFLIYHLKTFKNFIKWHIYFPSLHLQNPEHPHSTFLWILMINISHHSLVQILRGNQGLIVHCPLSYFSFEITIYYSPFKFLSKTFIHSIPNI